MDEDKKVKLKIATPNSLNFSQSGTNFSGTTLPKPMTDVEIQSKGKNKVIVGEERVNKPASTPKNRKRQVATLIILILLIIIAISLILLIVSPKPTKPSDIKLDFNVTKFELTQYPINPDVSVIPPLVENTKVMPGDSLGCIFQVKSNANEESDITENLDVFLRIKAFAVCNENYYSNMFDLAFFDDTQWYKGVDGYYYYKAKLSPNVELNVGKSIHFKESIGNEFSGKTINIEIWAQVLQADYQAIEELWETAPYDWKVSFR